MWLPLVALAQALGILAADRGFVSTCVALALAVVFLAGAARTSRPLLRFAFTLGVAGTAGAASLAARLEAAAEGRPAAPLVTTLEGTVSRVTRFGDGLELDLVARSALAGEPAPPARVRLRERRLLGGEASPLGNALPGDRLRLRVRLRPPRSLANPGGRNRERALARAGFGAIGHLVHPALVVRLPEREGLRPLRRLHALRLRAGERLSARGPGGGLLRALALGDRGGLPDDARRAFRRHGVAHLLAVSGLHLALVAALAYRLAHRALLESVALAVRLDPRRLALLSAALAALAYALLAGWGVPVRRALAILLGLTLALFARRPVRGTAALAAAAIGVLVCEPQALFDAGAQLSFAASAALMFAVRERRDVAATKQRVPAMRRRMEALLRPSATAIAATAPLAAFHLGISSPWALPANLVLIPWTGLVLLPAALVAAALTALEPAGLLGGWLLDGCATLAAATLRLLIALAARLPASEVARPAWPTLLMAAAITVFAVRSRRTGLRVLGALAVIALLSLAPPSAIRPASPRAVFLDVGQGDATLVQGREGTVLVDAGTALPGGPDLGRTVVVPALRALGVARLDLVVVSHADLDHRGGVGAVLEAIPVERVWIPRGEAASEALAELRDAARARGVSVLERGAGDAPEQAGEIVVAPLWPPADATGLADNDRSLVVRIDVAGARVLLPGDLEAAGEAALLALRPDLGADVLKLPHHGSLTSSSSALLTAVGGSLAVASSSFQGRFGMPHPAVVARAREAGYSLWWTGRDGAVLVGLGPRLWARGWRKPDP